MPCGHLHAPLAVAARRPHPPAPGRRRRTGALTALLLLAAACSSPPPSHFTRLWPQKVEQARSGPPVLGVSTEDGVLILARPGYVPEDLFDMQFPVGNSMVVDYGKLDRVNDNLAVVNPITARFAQGRFAATLPESDETLYVAVRDDADAPVMRPASLWHAGALGDWLSVDASDGPADDLARDYAGTGIYVRRDDRWEICGVLSGLVAELEGDDDSRGLGFLGLAELARILPDQLPYYLHLDRPLRPDFEFGVPLQPGDLKVWPAQPGDTGAETPADDAAAEGDTAPAADEGAEPAPEPADDSDAPPPADDTPEGDNPDDDAGDDDPEPSDDGR